MAYSLTLASVVVATVGLGGVASAATPAAGGSVTGIQLSGAGEYFTPDFLPSNHPDVTAGTQVGFVVRTLGANAAPTGDLTTAASLTETHGTCAGGFCISTVAGDQTVTATYGGFTATIPVTVRAASGAVSLQPANATVGAGQAVAYTTRIADQYGNVAAGGVYAYLTDAHGVEVRCSGGDTPVTRLAPKPSVCVPPAPGTYTVTAGTLSTTLTAVAAKPLAAKHLVITLKSGGTTVSQAQASSVAFHVEEVGADGADLGDVTSSVFLSVQDGGFCQATAICGLYDPAGPAPVSAFLTSDPSVVGGTVVTITPAPVGVLTVSPGSSRISVGQRALLQVTDHNDTGAASAATIQSVRVSGPHGEAATGMACQTQTSSVSCTPSASGVYRVTVTSASGHTGVAFVGTDAAPGTVTRIAETLSAPSVAAGNPVSATVEGYDAAGHDVGDVTAGSTVYSQGGFTSYSSSGAFTPQYGRGAALGATFGSLASPIAYVAVTPAAQVYASAKVPPLPHSSFDSLLEVPVGAAEAYSAVYTDGFGNPSAPQRGSTTTWQVVDADLQPVSSGSCTATGVCTATKPGTYIVLLTYTPPAGGTPETEQYGFDAVTPAGPPVGISYFSPLEPGAPVFETSPGDTFEVHATTVDAHGNRLADVSYALASTLAGGTCGAPDTCTAGRAAGTVPLTSTFRSWTTTGSVAVDGLSLTPTSATASVGTPIPLSFVYKDYAKPAIDLGRLGDPISITDSRGNPAGSCFTNQSQSQQPFVPYCVATEAGTLTVSGSYGSYSASSPVTVTAEPTGPAVPTLRITADGGTGPVQNGFVLSADLLDASGRDLGPAAGALFAVQNGSCPSGHSPCSVDGGPGTYLVTAELLQGDGSVVFGTLDVVVQNPATSLAISPAAASVTVGSTQSFTLTALDASGRPGASFTPADWLVTDASGAVVPSTSVRCRAPDIDVEACTVLVAGSYTVSAYSPGYAAVSAVLSTSANARPLARIVLSPRNATFLAGSVMTFKAEGYDAAGHDLGNVTAGTFVSTDEQNCGPTANGCVSTTPGSYAVRAADGAATDTTTFTIVPGNPGSVKSSPVYASIQLGRSQTYTLAFADAAGNPTTRTGAYPVQGASFVAAGSSATPTACTGLVCTPTKAGTYTVTVSASTGGAHPAVLKSTATLVVTTPPGTPVALQIVGAQPQVTAREAQLFQVETVDAAGNVLGVVTSSATVTASGGACSFTGSTDEECTVALPGPARITAAYQGLTGTFDYTVVAGESAPTATRIAIIAPATVTLATMRDFRVEAYDAVGTDLGEVTRAATRSAVGYYPGNATLTATWDGLTASVTVPVSG